MTYTDSILPKTVSAVVPCYNAGHRLRPVIEKLTPIVPSVCVVDDGSTDGCIENIRALPVRIVALERNCGKGVALRAGIEAALEDSGVTCVACLDADGQHDPAELPGLFEAFTARNADLLIGSRIFQRKDVPLRSWFGNTLTITVAGALLGQRVPDTQSGYRLLSRRFLEAVLPAMRGVRYEFEMEMLARAIRGGYRVEAAPIATIYETGNPSSHFRKIEDSWRIYRTLWRVAREARKAQ
jgi:glycosyltransferase involved in cell wall biosynthesis